MPPPIEQLAEKLIGARGLDYNAAYTALKAHLATISDEKFEEEMARVTNPDIFRYLLAAGLKGDRWNVAAKRWERLVR